MADSPLFRRFNKLINDQKAAIRKMLAFEAQKKAGSAGRAPVRKNPYRTPAGGNADGQWLWNSMLSKMGDIGSIINAMLRPNGKSLTPDIEKELDAATKLLQSFGYDVGKPGTSGPSGPGSPGDSSQPPIAQVVRELVDESKPRPSRPTGEIVSPSLPRRGQPKPSARPSTQPREQPQDQPGTSRDNSQTEDSPVDRATGLVEGMIPVRSSNVHSIGWEWNDNDPRRGNLLVRFLGGTGKERSGPGSLYRYKDVPRPVFDAFKRAASKGGFVWDELRVRGTVSGHQYDYELAGTDAAGYVPRQAGLKRGEKGEYFMPRNFAGRRSSLPERQVRGSRQELTPDFRGKAKNLNFRAGRRS